MANAVWTADGFEATVKVLREHPNSPGVFEVQGVFGRAWVRDCCLTWI